MTGNTPLMLAVKDNKTPLIDRLVELGSDVCARNNVSKLRYLSHMIFIRRNYYNYSKNYAHKMTLYLQFAGDE